MQSIMVKFYLMITILFMLSFLSGCSTAIQKQVPDASWTQFASPQLDRSDYVVLGRVEGSSTTVSFLFGIIQSIDGNLQILGIKFFEDRYAVKTGFLNLFSDRTQDRAYFETMIKCPDADAILRRTITVEESGIPFIYTTETVRCIGKAVKIKTDEELNNEIN